MILRGLLIGLGFVFASLPLPSGATARDVHLTNPIRLNGHPLSCPDPDVFRSGASHTWVAACTSDFGQLNPNAEGNAAFPLYVSHDFAHWEFRNFVFPPGRHPWQASAPLGDWPGGRYWAPEIHFIAGKWLAYFAANLDPGQFQRVYHHAIAPGTMGLFVAWTQDLFGGRWQTRLLHYAGQFNGVRGNSQERLGGVIDPTVARDPASGQLEIAWAKQNNQIFIGQLTPSGLALRPRVRFAVGVQYAWECNPGGFAAGCCVEGPVLYADRDHGVTDLFFNGASTWRGNYKVGVAVSDDPLKTWRTYPQPLLQSGNGLLGPGVGGQPTVGPNSQLYIFFHVQLRPSYDSQERYLAVAPLRYNTSDRVRISDPAPPGGHGSPAVGTSRLVPIPRIGDGAPAPAIRLGS